MTPRIDSLAIAYAARQQQAELLWAELKQDILHKPELTRRYCACLRLCGRLQKKIKELT